MRFYLPFRHKVGLRKHDKLGFLRETLAKRDKFSTNCAVCGRRVVLFCRDEDALYSLAFRTVKDFADFERLYRRCLEEVARVGS